MKTIFTFRSYRFTVPVFFLLFVAFGLAAQTKHQVAVTNNVFTPANLTITAGDEVVWTNTQGHHNVNGTTATFPSNPASFGNSLGMNWTFSHTFTTPGVYDYQCDPHVGLGMVGKITVNPKATGPLTLTVNFSSMTPHVGQTLWISLIDQATKMEVARVKKTVTVAFSAELSGIEAGKSYTVDFYADHNKNGVYDAPPADHAWRMQLTNVTGNSVLNFTHNTSFTNIDWRNKLTLRFTGMTPHVGQKLTLFLVRVDTGLYQDTITVATVPGAAFDVNSYKIKPGLNYNIDFYADHNKNGKYDSPPADHAWRMQLSQVKGDTIMSFAHNTSFTDILKVTSVPGLTDMNEQFRLYPNPASSSITLKVPVNHLAVRSLKVYSITGALVEEMPVSAKTNTHTFNIEQLKNGLYFLEINSGEKREVLKFVKK